VTARKKKRRTKSRKNKEKNVQNRWTKPAKARARARKKTGYSCILLLFKNSSSLCSSLVATRPPTLRLLPGDVSLAGDTQSSRQPDQLTPTATLALAD
jgi:hypothetical protein